VRLKRDLHASKSHLHLDLIIDDAIVQVGHVLLWQVRAIIYPPVILQEVLRRGVQQRCKVLQLPEGLKIVFISNDLWQKNVHLYLDQVLAMQLACACHDRVQTHAQQDDRCGLGQHLLGHLVLNLRVVRVSVQQDDRVGQHIAHVRALEGVRIAAHIALCKFLHQPVDLLGLARQPEA
jgi:hypothetical protein